MNKSKWLLSRFHRYMLDRDQKMHKKGTLFCILSGGLIGLALAIMMPATTTLQTQSTQWGVSFWGWMIVLASVALLASVFSFLGTKLSYTAGLGFMKNMQTIVGNKVARLPLGWFQADSAGKLSRMVTQEMISTGQTAAFFIGQLLKMRLQSLFSVLPHGFGIGSLVCF